MVFNVSLNKSVPIRQRMAIGDEYGRFVAEATYPSDGVKPAKYPTPTSQLSSYLMDHALDDSLWP